MNAITYCMNVHRGEDIAAVKDALARVTIPLREAFKIEGAFPVGLRLGAQAAKMLRDPETFRNFSNFLTHNKLAVMGINGFPYDNFHDEVVKEKVYLPDWMHPDRSAYTRNLFYALSNFPIARLGDHSPSVTTVPLAFSPTVLTPALIATISVQSSTSHCPSSLLPTATTEPSMHRPTV